MLIIDWWFMLFSWVPVSFFRKSFDFRNDRIKSTFVERILSHSREKSNNLIGIRKRQTPKLLGLCVCVCVSDCERAVLSLFYVYFFFVLFILFCGGFLSPSTKRNSFICVSYEYIKEQWWRWKKWQFRYDDS